MCDAGCSARCSLQQHGLEILQWRWCSWTRQSALSQVQAGGQHAHNTVQCRSGEGVWLQILVVCDTGCLLLDTYVLVINPGHQIQSKAGVWSPVLASKSNPHITNGASALFNWISLCWQLSTGMSSALALALHLFSVFVNFTLAMTCLPVCTEASELTFVGVLRIC